MKSDYCPRIKPLSCDVKDYVVIAIGTPAWRYTMAPAMLTFLKRQGWNAKTVIPFMTHGGWPGHVLKDIKTCCKGADFVSGMEIRFDSDGDSKMLTPQSEIAVWMEQMKQEVLQGGMYEIRIGEESTGWSCLIMKRKKTPWICRLVLCSCNPIPRQSISS